MDIELGVPGQIMPPADRAIAMAQRAEQAGFDAAWWPCHLMGWHADALWTEDLTPLAAVQANPHLYFDPLVMMGAVGAQTERLRVGVVVTDLIRRHPAVAAQQLLTIDHLAKGRAILGLGSGEQMNITPYGLPFDKPVGRLSEGIEIMRRLWAAEGPIDFDGRFHTLRSAVLGLQPYGGTPPPIWIAAHGPRMLQLTGRQGDGWLPTKIAPEEYARSRGEILAAGKEAGRDMGHFTPGMLGYVLLAPDEATLQHLTSQPLVRYMCVMLPPEIYRSMGLAPPMGESGFHAVIPAAMSREEGMRIVDAIPPEVVRYYAFCGTPEQVAEEITTYHRAGLRHLVAWNITAFGDPSLAGWSFKALAELKELLAAA